jgi:hypothetical protein
VWPNSKPSAINPQPYTLNLKPYTQLLNPPPSNRFPLSNNTAGAPLFLYECSGEEIGGGVCCAPGTPKPSTPNPTPPTLTSQPPTPNPKPHTPSAEELPENEGGLPLKRWRAGRGYLSCLKRISYRTWLKPRPESGRDCLICSIFARKRIPFPSSSSHRCQGRLNLACSFDYRGTSLIRIFYPHWTIEGP